ncbi:Uncharacterised protein [Moraxella caprae]|uniref:Uncharacterized protein n=2 Tax=Moraxella caprae TaxID=90240 RepID=A0A378U6L7_9GAMM|nr:Uncharacterised protein [Moraxella caprae]
MIRNKEMLFDVSMGKGDDALYVAGDVTSNIRIDMGDGNDYLYTGGEFGTGHGGVNTNFAHGCW